ncbi:TPA: hypothetical protein ACX6S4_003009 [Photobacterium damselae]
MQNITLTTGQSHFQSDPQQFRKIGFNEIVACAHTPHDLSQHPYNSVIEKRYVKSKCSWLIPSDCDSKQKDSMIVHGNYSLLIADLDYGNILQSAIVDILKTLGISSYLIYDTVSSTNLYRRSRVLVPLNEPVGYTVWVILQRYLTFQFNADDAMENANQISYLPTLSAGNKACYQVSTSEGEHLDPFQSEFAQHAIELAQTYTTEDKQPIPSLPQQDPVSHKTHSTGDGYIDPIAEFNRANDWSALLRYCGFKKGYGNRWIAPCSSSGVPGVTISTKYRAEGGYVSSHSSDPLSDGKLHDKLDVWCVYARPGMTLGNVLREFAESHVVCGGLTLQQHNQNVFKANKSGVVV